MKTKLTLEEVEKYKKDGFVVVRDLLSDAIVNQLREECDRIQNEADESNNKSFYYFENSESDPGKRLLRRVEHLSGSSKLVRDLLESEEVMGRVGQLYGEEAALFKDKFNLKLPGGSGFKAHVDGHFKWRDTDGEERKGWLEYGTEFINAVVPVDASTIQNGCLQVASLQDTFEYIGKTYDEIASRVVDRGPDTLPEDEEKLKFYHLEANPGDVIFFDWRCVHRSDANKSDSSRRILYSTYNKLSEGDNEAEYYADKKGSSEPLARKALS